MIHVEASGDVDEHRERAMTRALRIDAEMGQVRLSANT